MATAFVLLVCGSNAMAPLLPLYEQQLGLTALDSAVVFSGYFLGLVGILILGARTRLVAASRVVLPVALIVGLAGDVALIFGSSAPIWLLMGRILVGASVALGTGAAAAVMVAVRGEDGRAFLATGSLIGACVGLLAATVIVALLPGPLITVYAINAAVMLLALIVLLAVLRSAQLPAVLSKRKPMVPVCDGAVAQALDSARPGLSVGVRTTDVPILTRRLRSGAYLTGGAGWAIGALTVGALPAALVATGTVGSVTAGVAVGGVCLLTSCLTSLRGIGAPHARWWPLLLAAAWAMVTAGIWATSVVLAIAGCALGGVAQAASYRSGLRRLTIGLNPLRQGQVASAYSAVAYTSCALLLLLSGWLQLQLGTVRGLTVLAAGYAVVCCVTIALLRVPGGRAKSADSRTATDETAGQQGWAPARNMLN